MQYDTGISSNARKHQESCNVAYDVPMLVASCVLVLLCLLVTHTPSLAETRVSPVEKYLQQSKAEGKTPNRLINEVSPYLMQHAYNPVQWHAWGDEAFARAKKENKPIFLSIGYSTCHWCHVMARESFENKTIAAILNRHFISIKVDREERPDIDAVYMAATQLLNGHGGWPMTVLMNHDLEPFHAGIYYPPESVDGSRGLKELLLEVQQLWKQERQRVENVADNITAMIVSAAEKNIPAEKLDITINSKALDQIRLAFDEEHGGFGYAPKFPRFGLFEFLLAQSGRDNEGGAISGKMLDDTLTAMAQGGFFDQLGGGFHRYSVDSEWQVPHFEKMLYSQALLAMVYMRSYQLEGNPLYREVSRKTLDFVLREMTSEQGGFYSALDADSVRPDKPGEHAEGAYYLWSEQELKKQLTPMQFDFVQQYYAIDSTGNIVSDPQEEFSGLNILSVSEQYRHALLTDGQRKLLDAVNTKLLDQRQQRPRPHLDDKIITAWNGMMITAFAMAFEIYADEKYHQAAENAAVFIHDQLINRQNGQLLRRYRNQQAGIEAGLQDYVWYIRGLIELYRAGENKKWLQLAVELSDRQDELFLDKTNGGYFEHSDKDVNLLFRSKSIYDGALPAANAIALFNMGMIFRYTDNERWKKNAKQLLAAYAASINRDPLASTMVLGVRITHGSLLAD